MARARNLKPGFFRDAALVELPIETRLLFPGLWTLADRSGRLDDKPKQIKMEIYPADNFDVDDLLNQLAGAELIIRYTVAGRNYIQIRSFEKHQNPHRDEKASIIPEPPEHGVSTVQTPCEHDGNLASTSNLSPSTFNPQPISLNLSPPISLKPRKVKSLAAALPTAAEKDGDTALQQTCKAVWQAYALAYEDKYGARPIRNPKVNSCIKTFCGRVPMDEAPLIAQFYLTHSNAFYTVKMHPVEFLLGDAEKLRTEWITNRRVTLTSARQADRTQTTGDVFRELIHEEGMSHEQEIT